MTTTQFMAAKLAGSGLVPTDLDASATADGFRIPYFRPDGSTHPVMFRERLMHPQGGRKYTQPSAAEFADPLDTTYPYLNPYILGGMTWSQIGGQSPKRLLIVEGELKAACAGKLLHRPAIGIGGCANGTRHTEEGLHFLHPVIAQLIAPHDEVEVVLDADVLTNPQVNLAAGTLRRALRWRTQNVRFVLLPPGPDGTKAGFDDWAVPLPLDQVDRLYGALPRLTGCEGDGFLENLPTLWAYLGLDRSGPKGTPAKSEANLARILDFHEHFLERYYFDQMRRVVVDRRVREPVAQHNFAMREAAWLQTHVGMRGATKDSAADLLQMFEFKPTYCVNELHADIKAVAWDGEGRLETMFIKACGAEDDIAHRAIGRNWLVSAVARAFRPGCKVDTMLILEGRQGTKKSSALEVIGGPFYRAITSTMEQGSGKDFLLAAHTAWIADMVELDAFRYSDFARIKGLISVATDVLRPPYGRDTRELARHFVFTGTTNNDDYLRDDTGNRRFWPVRCHGTIDLDWLRRHRAQLLAEAYHRFLQGQLWYDMPQEALEALQAQRMEHDPWADVVATILQDMSKARVIAVNGEKYLFVASNEILIYMGYSQKEMTPGILRRLARTFKVSFPDWQAHHYRGRPLNIAGALTPNARGYILALTPRIRQALTPSQISQPD